MQTPCLKSFKTGSCLSTKRPARANRLIVHAASTQDGQKAREALTKLMDSTRCNPILIRLAWHDSGTYSVEAKDQPWPKPGGATASIRFKPELGHAANNGLDIALNLLNPIKEEVPDMSWSDLIQLGSAVAIEHAGGPHVPLRFGRLDAQSGDDCTPDDRLPVSQQTKD
jgi:L-ascorbate peroxidase